MMLYVTDAKAKLRKKEIFASNAKWTDADEKRGRKVMDMIIESDRKYKLRNSVLGSIDHSMQIAVL